MKAFFSRMDGFEVVDFTKLRKRSFLNVEGALGVPIKDLLCE